jgi:hypothetical protein
LADQQTALRRLEDGSIASNSLICKRKVFPGVRWHA